MVFLVLGAVGLAVAFWGLFEDVRSIAQPFYAYAWWSYILLLDGAVALRRGSSLLTTRWHVLAPVVVWSVSFWFSFELLNLRFQNWYYVGVFAGNNAADMVIGPLFGVLSFATVFAGLFETSDFLASLGRHPAEGPRTRARALPIAASYAVQALGAVMVALSLLFPYYLAPLVWGSLTFLLDPWSYRHGARSLLAEVESGHGRTVGRLLLAGLVCGLVWESFNFLAPQKWIYTVRGLDRAKLFEMPVLGFLGFPALALDAFSFFAFVSYWMHGNRTWENPEDVRQSLAPRRGLSPGRFAATLPLHVLLWAGVAFAMQWVNVGSVELTLQDIPALGASVPRLLEHGIDRPRRLLHALDDPAGRRELERELGLSARELEAVADEVRLYSFEGIGHHHGALLEELGIRNLDELARADPDALFEWMSAARGDRTFPALRRDMVRVWVLAARDRQRAAGSGTGPAPLPIPRVRGGPS
jgi:Domain of unknown function (DUF4332)